MTAATAWESGRLGAGIGRRLLFGRMFEDVAIERAVFAGKGRIFCIASAGDTAISLAEQHAVVACDINPVQLAYARARAAGEPRRPGDADRAMALARKLIPFTGWKPKELRDFLRMYNIATQQAFWIRRLNNRRFRLGTDLLLSRFVLRWMYSKALLGSLEPHFGRVLRARLERTFGRHANAMNPYMRAMFTGSAKEKPVDTATAATIRWEEGDAASVLEREPPGSIEGFTLSNILDGASESYRQRLMDAVRRAAAPGAVIVMRSFAKTAPWPGGEDYAAEDRSALWGAVCVAPVWPEEAPEA